MYRMLFIWLLAVVVTGNGGAVRSSGIEQFWAEDYQAFDNLYGRTSDKDLFRRSVVPSVLARAAKPAGHDLTKHNTYSTPDLTSKYNAYSTSDLSSKFNKQGKEAERNVQDFGDLFDSDDSPYADRYIRLLAEQQLKSFDKTKPKAGSKYFTNSYFKPINKKNNKDLYNYLENLEAYAHRKKNSNFKPDQVKSNGNTKHAFVYNVPAPIRCGKKGCKNSKRPSKISLINGPYVKRIKHRIVHY